MFVRTALRKFASLLWACKIQSLWWQQSLRQMCPLCTEMPFVSTTGSVLFSVFISITLESKASCFLLPLPLLSQNFPCLSSARVQLFRFPTSLSLKADSSEPWCWHCKVGLSAEAAPGPDRSCFSWLRRGDAFSHVLSTSSVADPLCLMCSRNHSRRGANEAFVWPVASCSGGAWSKAC